MANFDGTGPGVHRCSACHEAGIETMVSQCRCRCDRTPKYDALCKEHRPDKTETVGEKALREVLAMPLPSELLEIK